MVLLGGHWRKGWIGGWRFLTLVSPEVLALEYFIAGSSQLKTKRITKGIMKRRMTELGNKELTLFGLEYKKSAIPNTQLLFHHPYQSDLLVVDFYAAVKISRMTKVACWAQK